MQCLYILQVIEAIANAIASTEGCNLLDVDPGASTNRTVYTFVGTPEAIVEGALNGARVAYQAIDMTRHKGSQRERERGVLLRRLNLKEKSKLLCMENL